MAIIGAIDTLPLHVTDIHGYLVQAIFYIFSRSMRVDRAILPVTGMCGCQKTGALVYLCRIWGNRRNVEQVFSPGLSGIYTTSAWV